MDRPTTTTINLHLFSYGINVGSYEKYPDDSIIYDIRKEHTEHVKIPEGKYQSGLDASFRKKLLKNENFAELLEKIKTDICNLQIDAEATQRPINVVIMCHRGKHRSVSIVEELFNHFNNYNYCDDTKNMNIKYNISKVHLSMD